MRILHVLAPGPAGGAESVVRALATGHAREGHRVAVLAVLSEPSGSHPFVHALRGGAVAVIPLELDARRYLRERRVFTEILLERRPQVVHTHSYRADVVDGPVARRRGIPVVSTVHGFTGGGWRNRLYERLQVRALRHFDAVVAVSRPLEEELARRGVPRERIRLIRNRPCPPEEPEGRASARRILGVPGGVFHVGWIGRLSREKGPDVFLEALARLTDLPLLASVVGGGDEALHLRRLAGDLGVERRVRWHGVVQDAARLLAGFDCVVLSSRREGTPLVLLEAMAAGVPVVATAVGGVPDAAAGEAALLVPAEDPDAIARAIRALHRDPGSAALRAARARALVRRPSRGRTWLQEYADLYRRLAGGDGVLDHREAPEAVPTGRDR